ncbi:MAG TPA: HupE/UreJ family protein [Rubrivivax sp.]|nr:HupE/UreJ family protein [Rubrivivax sp.]
MTRTVLRSTLGLGVFALPALALAHAGSDGGGHPGFAAGFTHPFTGIDHLLAMLLIGLWSATLLRRAWVAPLAFVAALLAGALLAAAGLRLPAVEPLIALSLVLLGALLAARTAWPVAAMAAVAALFALFHGAAHGAELQGLSALAGMVLATALLHAIGLLAGHALQRHSVWWPRTAGIAASLAGAVLLFAAAW